MAAGETGDHGPSIVLLTVYKKRGLGPGQERALTLLPRGMDFTVLEKALLSTFVI